MLEGKYCLRCACETMQRVLSPALGPDYAPNAFQVPQPCWQCLECFARYILCPKGM
jgi:hypothetical protein